MKKSHQQKTVIIGLSGGVDSAVSALLLKQQGYHVIGIYMLNWDKEINGDILGSKADTELGCSSIKDYQDALAVAKQLGIELIKVNFVKEYWNLVFQRVLNEYTKALTPNPDILCNQYIKFGVLLNYIQKHYPGAYFATGHYAKLIKRKNQNYLKIPKDEHKDQTYFLCNLTNAQLDRVIFPLADLLKLQVREIALKHHLVVANKKDSTGICFIGERKFKLFLQNYLKQNTGNIILVPDHKVIGKHEGLPFYTIGQRQGLNVGGTKERIFVVDKKIKTNELLVAYESNKDQYLASNLVNLTNFIWIKPMTLTNNETKKFYVRFRHGQKLIACYIKKITSKTVQLYYPQTAQAVTPGQYAALYDASKTCLGGGKIKSSKLLK